MQIKLLELEGVGTRKSLRNVVVPFVYMVG